MIWLTSMVIGAMFAAGLFQMLRRNVVRAAIGLALMTNAVNLFLLAAGSVNATAPAFADATGTRADALPQALVLTAIVIGMGAFAFVLALVNIIAKRYRTADSDEVKGLRH